MCKSDVEIVTLVGGQTGCQFLKQQQYDYDYVLVQLQSNAQYWPCLRFECSLCVAPI